MADAAPHAAPLFIGWVITSRLRVAVPLAVPTPGTHLVLALQAHSDHGDWTQSTGHWLKVHGWVGSRTLVKAL